MEQALMFLLSIFLNPNFWWFLLLFVLPVAILPVTVRKVKKDSDSLPDRHQPEEMNQPIQGLSHLDEIKDMTKSQDPKRKR